MLMEQRRVRVSFAVRLIDDYTKQSGLVGDTVVRIVGNGRAGFQNASKYHVFTDVRETNVTVRVENPYYHSRDVAVNIVTLNPRNPVVVVTLSPNTLYPFPAGSTIVRGSVIDTGSNPIEGATVSAIGGTVTVRSGARGGFALYWGPLKEDDVEIVGGRRELTIGGSTTIRLRASHPSFQTKDVIIGKVREGELTLVGSPVQLNP